VAYLPYARIAPAPIGGGIDDRHAAHYVFQVMAHVRDSRLVRTRRWLAPVAVALTLILSLWVSAAQKAHSFELPHAHHAGEAVGHQAATDSASGEPCLPIGVGSDADRTSSNFGSVPAIHCHNGSVQLGNLIGDLALPMPPHVVAVLRPEASMVPLGIVLEPPLAPPRSLA
jgi:hypothetical protein